MHFRLVVARAFYGNKARAESFQAAHVLVAGILIDFSLAAEYSFTRHYRQAIRLCAAIAAAFANAVVDERALRWTCELAAFTAPAFFGSTGLIVNDRRYAGCFAVQMLYRIQFIACMQCYAVGEG